MNFACESHGCGPPQEAIDYQPEDFGGQLDLLQGHFARLQEWHGCGNRTRDLERGVVLRSSALHAEIQLAAASLLENVNLAAVLDLDFLLAAEEFAGLDCRNGWRRDGESGLQFRYTGLWRRRRQFSACG